MYNEGSLNSKICLIGEAPGITEVNLGRPFVGNSGNLLNELLLSSGILRSRCYITNVVKERPHNNNIAEFITFRGDNALTTKKYKMYELQLYEELAECKANVFVPLGNVALFALTKLTKITKRHGSLLSIYKGAGKNLAGRKVIPTIHPSACLHNQYSGGMYIYRYYILHDLAKVKKESEFPELKFTDRNLIVAPSFQDVMVFLENIKNNCNIIGFDIEVYNEEVSCISFAPSPYISMSIPFMESKTKGNYFSVGHELEIWKLIKSILEDKSITKVGQNIAFDMAFLFNRYGIITNPIEDTMIAQAIITPDIPKGLDTITTIYTDIPYYKDEGKKWKEGGGYTFWEYNAKDSIVCMDALPEMMDDLAEMDNINTYRRQKSIVPVLVYMQERGIKVNIEGMKKAKIDYQQELDNLQEQLNKSCGKDINCNSPKQLKELFYVTLGYPPYTKDGKMTTNETALKRLDRKGCKQADIVLKIRGISKLIGTYLNEQKVDKDGRFRCSFNPVGTVNGRLSSSTTIFGTGGNLQNWPPAAKQFLIADDNYIMYDLDLEQAENRIVGYTSPEQAMIHAFENSIVIHARTATMLSGLTIEEVIEQDKEGIPCGIGDGTKTWRFWGKKANHGLNYGEGYKKFSLDNEISEKEGKMIVDAYHAMYPGVRAGQQWIIKQLQKNRTLENCYGRKRLFLDRWGNALFNQAYNFNPQSTVADKINEDGLSYIWKSSFLKDVDIINQVHDSIVIQLPLSKPFAWHSAILTDIITSLEKPLKWKGTTFIIPVGVKMGFNLRDMVKVQPYESSILEIYNSLS